MYCVHVHSLDLLYVRAINWVIEIAITIVPNPHMLLDRISPTARYVSLLILLMLFLNSNIIRSLSCDDTTFHFYLNYFSSWESCMFCNLRLVY